MDNSLPPGKSFPEKKKKCFPGITAFYMIYRASLLCSGCSDGGLYCKLLWMHSSKPESISTITAHAGRLIFEGQRLLSPQINNLNNICGHSNLHVNLFLPEVFPKVTSLSRVPVRSTASDGRPFAIAVP